MNSHWRDCQAWRKIGLPLSTTSNEACKIYDAAVTQYIGWYEESSLGGLEGSLQKIHEADPGFVMGHVVSNGLKAISTCRSPQLDSEFRANLDHMVSLAENSDVTERERSHAHAVKLSAEGFKAEACGVWCDILLDHPTDMLAIKFAYDTYFDIGRLPEMRDTVGRVMPYWRPHMSHYGYLLGMHSFGLEETNYYDRAETVAWQALDINRRDAWALHSIVHTYEMTGRYDEGLKLLSETKQNWEVCGILSCHNFWHWALFHIEKVGPLSKQGGVMDMVDASSLLYRLEYEGINVGRRWNPIAERVAPHVEDHILCFNDAHFLVACLRADKKDAIVRMMESLKKFIVHEKGTTREIMNEVGAAVLQGLLAHDEGDFENAVELVYPVRYRFTQLGGSNAQRDLFNLFLIHAALKSANAKHKKYARQLLYERKTLRQNSPMTDRLIARAMVIHDD